MKPRSAKAKGRRFQNEVRELLLEHFKDQLEEGDLKTAIMGESGEDIQRSPLAKRILPFSFECKNQEKLNIWQAFAQAQENCDPDSTPLLVYKRNNSDAMVSLKFDDFLNMLNCGGEK